MKLVRGKTLEVALEEAGDQRVEVRHLAGFLEVFAKVCDAVSFAHSRGVIHRDLKPTNIMIDDYGQVYVLDWGSARVLPPSPAHERRVQLTEDNEPPSDLEPPGTLVGTYQYMAPEQLRGQNEELDERADVFALGATLYHVLAGQPPLSREDVVQLLQGRRVQPVAPEAHAPADSVPPELSRIALRAMGFAPEERYPSARALKDDVERFLHGTWDLPRTFVPAGSLVVAEGEAGNTAYVIVEGRCVAYRVEGDQEIELRTMGPGDVFGELAVFLETPRTASIRAATDATLIVVTREVLSKAVGLHSWMGAFVRALANRFREADEKLRGRP